MAKTMEYRTVSRAEAIEALEAAIKHHKKWSRSFFWSGGASWRRDKLSNEAEQANCRGRVRVYKAEAPLTFKFTGWCSPSRAHVYYAARWRINGQIVTMRQAQTLLKRLKQADAGMPAQKNKPPRGW